MLYSIRATFKNRNTTYMEGHPVFTKTFAEDKVRNQQWKQFLKKIKIKTGLEFSTVMELIRDQSMPFYEKGLLRNFILNSRDKQFKND